MANVAQTPKNSKLDRSKSPGLVSGREQKASKPEKTGRMTHRVAVISWIAGSVLGWVAIVYSVIRILE